MQVIESTGDELKGELRLELPGGTAVIKFSETDVALRVDSLMVPADQRNRGIGRRLMGYVICLADGMGKEVRLSARPIGKGSRDSDRLERLVRFYAHLGFQEVARGVTSVEMVRPCTRRSAERCGKTPPLC